MSGHPERKRQPVRGLAQDQRLPNQRSVSEYRALESSASCPIIFKHGLRSCQMEVRHG